MGRHWVSIVLITASASAATLARSPNPEFRRAEELYQRTEYVGAIDTIQRMAAKDAATYALLGKAHFMAGQFKEAAANLEKAVLEDSGNADYYDWLGRAYGRIAEQASFMSALGYARRTVRAFERAVELDSSNLEALSDVFEYYLQAPGIAGGGMGKAENVARRIAELSKAEYHWARARMAQQRKDAAAAEREFRAALESAPNEVGRTLDLATFLCSVGSYSESEALFRAAEEKYPASPKVLYAHAAAHIQSKRNLDEADAMLERYFQLQLTPDDPARREAAELMRSSKCLRLKSRQAD